MACIPLIPEPLCAVSDFNGFQLYRFTAPLCFPASLRTGCAVFFIRTGNLLIKKGTCRWFLSEKDFLLCHLGEPGSFLPLPDAPCELICLRFSLSAPDPGQLTDRKIPSDETDRRLLDRILQEAQKKIPDCCHMLKACLELLLVRLLKRQCPPQAPPLCLPSPGRDLFPPDALLSYLFSHLTQQLTLEKICRDTLMGRSQLEKLFHENFHCGVILYFHRMKVEEAKRLIRDSRMDLAQIADALGYRSAQYFSRQFKKLTGMSPAQYRRQCRKNGDRH